MLCKLSNAIALTLLMSLGIAGQAQAWDFSLEQQSTSDAVGEFLGDATSVTTSNPSDIPSTSISISGFLSPSDRDLYRIYLPVGTFTASTVNGTALDTQLFLFDVNGRGVTGNDDDDFEFSYQSTISQPIITEGIYYLGISQAGSNPQSQGGSIFRTVVRDSEVEDISSEAEDNSTVEVVAAPTPENPTIEGPGFSSPLNSWSAANYGGDPEAYTINLEGARAVPFEFSPTYGLAILGVWAGWKQLRKHKRRVLPGAQKNEIKALALKTRSYAIAWELEMKSRLVP